MEANQSQKSSWFSNKIILWIILTVFILVSLFGGGYGIKMYKAEQEEKIKRIDSMQSVMDLNDIIYQERYEKGLDSVAKTKVQRKTYYNDFIKWQTIAEKLYEERLLINDRDYPIGQLDTLAEFFQFSKKRNFIFNFE